MHYDGTAFAMGNTITILDKETDEPVERNYEISPQDFELMNKIYPSEERCSRSLDSQIGQKNDEIRKSSLKVASLDKQHERNNLQSTNNDVKSWILVLNTRYFSNISLIIDGKGQSKEIGFNFESGTEVRSSCSIVWHGKMFVFGGFNLKRQISVVDECKLTKKGELPFDMSLGTCAQRDNREVFICFEDWNDSSTWKNCHRSNGPLEAFSQLSNSTHDHRLTRIAVTSGKYSPLFNLVFTLLRIPYRCW